MLMVIKLRWKPLLVLLALLLVGYSGYFYYETRIKVVPEKLLSESLENLQKLRSYRYKVDLCLQRGEHQRQISLIEGERAADGSFHIWGTIEETPVDIYHLGRVTYMQVAPDGKWMTVPQNEVFAGDLFLTEINPQATFRFAGVSDLAYHGRDTVDGMKLHLLSCNPVVRNSFLEKHWQDFSYRLWVERRGPYLVRAEIQAKLKANDTDTMLMLVEFKDHNQHIDLQPPVQQVEESFAAGENN
jgi:hypothetical protein